MRPQTHKLKIEFIRQYKHKILIHFDYELFTESGDIGIRKVSRTLIDILSFFTPWHQKNGWVGQGIEAILADEEYRAIRVGEANQYPAAYQFNSSISGTPLTTLWPLPVATDIDLDKSLLLDSNRTVQSMLSDPRIDLTQTIPIVEIFGHQLHRLSPDFLILER